MPSRNYLEFVSELHDRLSTANHYMRQSLQVAQHQQKDAYDKDIRNMAFQTGDLVLRATHHSWNQVKQTNSIDSMRDHLK